MLIKDTSISHLWQNNNNKISFGEKGKNLTSLKRKNKSIKLILRKNNLIKKTLFKLNNTNITKEDEINN